jgi:serine protease DegQ
MRATPPLNYTARMDTSTDQGATGTLAALSEQLASAVERIAPSIVAVDAGRRRASSGIAWSEHHVVTADHILEDDDITLRLAGDETAKATIAGRDPSTDIALLHTDALLRPMERADLDAVKVGHFVLAVARDDEGAIGASFGIVSSLDGPWRTWRGGDVDRFVRPDLSLYPGFSGGALVDAAGKLIGMNTWGLSRRTALTLPAPTIARVAAQLESGGIKRGYLGVALQAVSLPASLRKKHGIEREGATIVVGVAPGGPADQAGVVMGDVLLALGEVRIEDIDDLQHALRGEVVGTTKTLRVLRADAPHELPITVAERSNDE